MSMRLMQVAGSSKARAVAGVLADEIRENGKCQLRAIGPTAVNQAIKAIAISRGFVAKNGIDLVCIPGFNNLDLPDGEMTAMVLTVLSK